MELAKGAKTAAFFAGALRGLVGGILLGAVVGLGAALVLHAALPAVVAATGWNLAGLAGFVSTGAIAEGAVVGTLNIVPLMVLNGVLFGLSTAITNGFSKMGAMEQQFNSAVTDAKLNQLAGRSHQLEQFVAQHVSNPVHHTHAPVAATPRHVQQILEKGPRVKVEKEAHKEVASSHAADAVVSRLEDAERTIH